MAREQSLTGRPRERAKAQAKATLPHICALCDYPIDMTADPKRDPLACTVDEWFPRHLGGSALDPDNTSLMHRHCNGSKGGRWPVTDAMRARSRANIERILASRAPTIHPW